MAQENELLSEKTKGRHPFTGGSRLFHGPIDDDDANTQHDRRSIASMTPMAQQSAQERFERVLVQQGKEGLGILTADGLTGKAGDPVWSVAGVTDHKGKV